MTDPAPAVSSILIAAVPPAWGRVQVALKRSLDLIVALLALIILAPVLVLIGLAIRLDSPGPALFKQQRVGKGGQLFTTMKFRSMFSGADDRTHREALRKLASGEPVSIVDGRPAFKPAGDIRVTRVGRFLRATGLDELPQAINVLRGEMSVVGPRPAIPYELELYKDWHYRRFAVRPGITGLWQIRRRATTNLDDVITQDLEYIDSFSLWLDIRIILITVPKIVFHAWSF